MSIHANKETEEKQPYSKLRSMLAARRQEIYEDLQYLSQSQELRNQGAANICDQAAASVEADIALGITEQDRRELQEIDDALIRIQDGTYGVCEDCQERISMRRLRALPQARRCLSCQVKCDRSHHHRWAPERRKWTEASVFDDGEDTTLCTLQHRRRRRAS